MRLRSGNNYGEDKAVTRQTDQDSTTDRVESSFRVDCTQEDSQEIPHHSTHHSTHRTTEGFFTRLTRKISCTLRVMFWLVTGLMVLGLLGALVYSTLQIIL